jgi:hypothetical protein
MLHGLEGNNKIVSLPVGVNVQRLHISCVLTTNDADPEHLRSQIGPVKYGFCGPPKDGCL